MKKQLLALALLGMGMTKAQTWSEDFSSTTAPTLPANWVQLSLDNLTPNSGVASYSFSATRGWVSRNATSLYPTYGRVAASTSWYSSAGISNDWLITPSFTVPTGAYFEWEAIALDPSFADGYRVMISTTGTATSAFTTTLLTVSAENSSWTARSLNLSAYVGQTVNIAFQNYSNDMYLLYVDNVKCNVPAANDGKVTSITNMPRYTVAGNKTVTGVFTNNGSATVNNASMRYRVDNGPVTSQTITMPGLTYLQTSNYSFTTPANLTVGTHTIKAWVDAVNGVNEVNKANDTANVVVYVASQSVTINALVEEFTSSTCGPCASLNSTFDPLLTTNSVNIAGSNLNAIKYQVNWPSPGNDPSYNPDVANRVTYYGINAAPTVLYNGTPGSGNQTNINTAKAMPAYATITPTITFSSGAVTANATITPFVTISSNSPIRVHQALVQSYYNYPGASTSQKDYKHAMRKMFPTGGTTYNTTDGTPIPVTFNQTLTYGSVAAGTPAQGSNNFWTNIGTFTYEYLVWVQDDVTDQILQSGSAFTSSISTVGVVEFAKESSIGIYPNPAKDYAVVGIKLNDRSTVEINIFDVTGKLVYTNKADEVFAGTNEIKINTSEFATGAYNVVVKTSEGISTEKLIITK